MPASPSDVDAGSTSGNSTILNRHSAELPACFGPAIPGELVYPQEFTEITEPLPEVVATILIQ